MPISVQNISLVSCWLISTILYAIAAFIKFRRIVTLFQFLIVSLAFTSLFTSLEFVYEAFQPNGRFATCETIDFNSLDAVPLILGPIAIVWLSIQELARVWSSMRQQPPGPGGHGGVSRSSSVT